jgi:sn-glycerol 3-phosphate transport system permease protein
MIFYLAALQAIPPNLYEAASIEGASRARVFFRVTLPLLGPTTLSSR